MLARRRRQNAKLRQEQLEENNKQLLEENRTLKLKAGLLSKEINI